MGEAPGPVKRRWGGDRCAVVARYCPWVEEGRVIADRFLLGECVGQGGMGEVYRAVDRTTGQTVALKIAATGARGRARALQEAEFLERLAHSSIVRFIAHGETLEGELYLAMEWLEGENLAARMARGRMDIRAAVSVVRQAASALAAAHSAGVVHRDVTPSNLFLVGDRDVRLIDFGVAAAADPETTGSEARSLVGTPHYMAPEQALGQDVGPEADVYGLGAVLFELLGGCPPFDADNPMALLGRIVLETAPRLRDFNPVVPAAIDLIVARALSKERHDRPSAAELAETLGRTSLQPSMLPPSGTTRIVAQTVDLPAAGERRMMVVVAAALPDGVAMPEPMAHALATAMGASATTRILRDGTFFAAFGGVHSRGNEIVLAARAALNVRRAHPVLRLAIATGLAEHNEHGTTGEAIDRAATALGVSERGDIVLDPRSVALLGSRFRVETLEDGRALLAYEVNDTLSPPTLLGRRTPFVGRTRELGLATGIYRETIEEAGTRVVLVTGEAGVGKSRLRAELLAELARTNAPPTVLLCRGDAAASDVVYGTIARALRRSCGADELQSRDARRALVIERLGACLLPGTEDEILPFIAELAEVHLPDACAPQLAAARNDPQLMRDRIRAAFVAWVQASASIRPLAILIDDAQHADADSLWLLAAAVQEVVQAPLFVVVLGRPEVELALPALLNGPSSRIELGPLGQRASAKLVRSCLVDADEATIQRLVARAGGNLLFLEELVRAWGMGEELPATVQAVVQAHLDNFPPEVRAVARAASVFSEAFWEEAVETLVPDVDVRTALSRLAEGEIVVRRAKSRLAGHKEWTFPTPLAREVAYQMLTPTDRQRLHGLAAAWLVAAGEKDEAMLARHLELAGDLTGAGKRYVLASARALASGAFDAAARSATSALSLGVQGEPRARAFLERAEARLRLGDYEGVASDGLAAASVADCGEKVRITGLGLAGHARRLQGRFGDALELLDSALSWRSDAADVEAERYKVRLWRCATKADCGRTPEAIRELAEITIAIGEHPDHGLAYLLASTEAYVASAAGDLATMLGAQRRALACAGDSLRMAQSLGSLSQALLLVGRFEDAARQAAEGIEIARAAGATRAEAVLRLSASRAKLRLGVPADGIVDAEAAVRLLERIDAIDLRAHARAVLALSYLGRASPGDGPRALELARQARAEAPHDGIALGWAALALGRCLLASGDAAGACEVLGPAAHQSDRRHVAIHLALFEALDLLGRQEDADAVLTEANGEIERTAALIRDAELAAGYRSIEEHARIAALVEERRAATASAS